MPEQAAEIKPTITNQIVTPHSPAGGTNAIYERWSDGTVRKGLILNGKPMGGKEPQILSKEDLQRYDIDWDKKLLPLKKNLNKFSLFFSNALTFKQHTSDVI